MVDIFKKIRNDTDHKNTTSLKFKKDLDKFLGDDNRRGNYLELGTFTGDTTAILAKHAKKNGHHVYTIEHHLKNIQQAKKLLKALDLLDCVTFLQVDLYESNWTTKIKHQINTVFVDANHKVDYVIKDTKNVLKLNPAWIIYHDYGLNPIDGGVKEALKRMKLTIYRKIGGEIGEWVNTAGSHDCEAVIVENNTISL